MSEPHAIIHRTGPLFVPGLVDGRVRQTVRGVLEAMASVVEQAAKEATPVGVSGASRRAIKRATVSDLEVIVATDEPTGAFIETGTRPHWAPPGALGLWVQRVMGISNEKDMVTSGGRRLIGQGRGRAMKTGGRLGKKQAEAVQTRGTPMGNRAVVYGWRTIAFLIARAISRRGTAARAQGKPQFGSSPGVAGYWPFAAGVAAAEARRGEFQEFLARNLTQDLGGGA